MINDKVAFIISMYDEYEIVLKTLNAIVTQYKDPIIIVVRSDNGEEKNEWTSIKQLATKSIILPNLASKYHRFILPAYAVTRNFSKGFSLLHEKVEYIVALLGDTLIYNPKPLHSMATKMIQRKKYLCCCNAYDQYFHAKESTPEKIIASRYQGSDTTDFSAVLFILDGKKFQQTKCFTDIKVINDFSSEQCLGDETLKHFSKKEILLKTIILNAKKKYFFYSFMDGIYSFTNGITYHAGTGKPGR